MKTHLGRSSFTKTLNATCNLANPSHYDPYDYRSGIVIWIMDGIEKADVEFVFPNFLVKNEEVPTNTGVVYKLCDGAMMSWHGATHRHCTSIQTPVASVQTQPNGVCPIPDIDVYGFHFVNSMPNIEVLPSVQQIQYKKILQKVMLNTMDKIDKSINQENEMTSTSSNESINNHQLPKAENETERKCKRRS